MATSDPNKKPRTCPWPPVPKSSAMPPSSWSTRIGFKPKFFGETNASDSGQIALPRKPKEPSSTVDLEIGRVSATTTAINGEAENHKVSSPPSDKDQPVKRMRDSDGGAVPKSSVPSANGAATTITEPSQVQMLLVFDVNLKWLLLVF